MNEQDRTRIAAFDIPQSHMEGKRMKVSYKVFTGELLKIEREPNQMSFLTIGDNSLKQSFKYQLEILDEETDARISFRSVSLKDVRFLGGKVSFGQ